MRCAAISSITRIGDCSTTAPVCDLTLVGHGLGRDGLWAWPYPWRAEIVPVLIFGMTCGIAYKRELSLLMSTSLLIFLGLVCGYGLGEFVVLVGSTATAILLLGRIRSRSKLIKVGFFTGLATFGLYLITGLLQGQSLGKPLVQMAFRKTDCGPLPPVSS